MLETIWFALWGLLWALYFMLDGFDLGMGAMMPFLAKSEDDKRTIYNAGGPFWDGNEVWLITAGGVTFAAFPQVYATMFSGLYLPLLLLLFALILRGVSWEFRNKVDSDGWRRVWDWCHVLGSFVPALLLGVAFANIFRGLPIDADHVMDIGLIGLLNPYGLLGGVVFVALFSMHGALWLAHRSLGDLHVRSVKMALTLWPVVLLGAVVFLVYTGMETNLYANYMKYPPLLIILVGMVCALVLVRVFAAAGKILTAWWMSSATILGVTFFGVAGMFPALLPSSIDPAFSLTAFKHSSSTLTLSIMLGVTLVFVPIILAYQAWVYKTFADKIDEDALNYEEAY